ncbi:MAG: sensor histidine kinase [Candidatus Obscuribacterales bacterium]
MVIVSMPVVLSMVFTIALIGILKEAEAQLQREAFASKVLALASRVNKLYYEGVYDGYLYHMTRSEMAHERAGKCAAEIPINEKKLESLLSNNDRERKLFRQAQESGADIQQVLAEVNKGAPEDLGGTVDSKVFRRVVFQRLYKLNSDYTEIIDYAQGLEKSDPEGSVQSRNLIVIFAIIGIAANVMLALGLSVYFTRNITSRLDTITDNARRLAREAPLNPELTGDDEIADLDGVFHQMARLLDEANRKEKALVENAVNVLASIDDGLKFIEVSPASSKIWGYDPSELVGTRVLNLFARAEDASAIFQGLLDSKEQQNFDSAMRHRDGKIIDVRWDVHWAESEKALFCVASDVTREKELMRFKQQLIDTVAHDLRTPLTSIQSTLNLISMGVMGEVPGKIHERIRGAEKQSERLIRLINDLLDFERLESGHMKLSMVPTSLQLIIDESVNAVAGYLESTGLTLNKPTRSFESDAASKPDSGSESSMKVMVDPDRIVQVLVNLLSNAIKFSPKDGVVDIDVSRDRDLVRIAVVDAGPGVPAEHQERIFERFKMVDDERQTGKTGSGLGLAICKQIVELHGGTIGVDNNSGQGSTFYFTVPIAGDS